MNKNICITLKLAKGGHLRKINLKIKLKICTTFFRLILKVTKSMSSKLRRENQ